MHIYPAGAIGLDSDPMLLQIARDTVTAANSWESMNSTSSIFPAAARVGYDPDTLLAKLRTLKFQPNGIVYNEFHMLENSSVVPNTIDEMLLQSYEGVLRFFPVWPKEKDAGFRTLRARGAFLVSADLSHGKVTNVSILSEQGRICTVQNPWPGCRVQVVRGGRQAEVVEGKRFSIFTSRGDQIELLPETPE